MNQYQYVPSCAEWIPPLQTMLLIRRQDRSLEVLLVYFWQLNKA
jgi:hypothetical protein